ncbi:MAG: helix-turn-helix domain-containing protein [Parabacteroides sp.]
MENLPLVEIADMNKAIVGIEHFQNDLSIAEMRGTPMEAAHMATPVRMNALAFVLITQGTTRIDIDYKPYEIGPNHLVVIMPTHAISTAISSPDFRAKLVIISKEYIEICRPSSSGPSIVHYMQIRKSPCFQLKADDTLFLDQYIESIREKIKDHTHLFQRERLQNALIGLFLEIANILGQNKDSVSTMKLSRKEELFEQFLQLLYVHCKEQHVVSFYADKLFITPQYLSLVLKGLTGKSANKWIDDALIMEARVLLKAPQATVQQVADALHFSDQSTFGKFFKKHMGISPLEYRKQL